MFPFIYYYLFPGLFAKLWNKKKGIVLFHIFSWSPVNLKILKNSICFFASSISFITEYIFSVISSWNYFFKSFNSGCHIEDFFKTPMKKFYFFIKQIDAQIYFIKIST